MVTLPKHEIEKSFQLSKKIVFKAKNSDGRPELSLVIQNEYLAELAYNSFKGLLMRYNTGISSLSEISMIINKKRGSFIDLILFGSDQLNKIKLNELLLQRSNKIINTDICRQVIKLYNLKIKSVDFKNFINTVPDNSKIDFELCISDKEPLYVATSYPPFRPITSQGYVITHLYQIL